MAMLRSGHGKALRHRLPPLPSLLGLDRSGKLDRLGIAQPCGEGLNIVGDFEHRTALTCFQGGEARVRDSRWVRDSAGRSAVTASYLMHRMRTSKQGRMNALADHSEGIFVGIAVIVLALAALPLLVSGFFHVRDWCRRRWK
jgi:hypothetical protein